MLPERDDTFTGSCTLFLSYTFPDTCESSVKFKIISIRVENQHLHQINVPEYIGFESKICTLFIIAPVLTMMRTGFSETRSKYENK